MQRTNTRAIPAPVRQAPAQFSGKVHVRGSKTPPVHLSPDQMAAYLYAVVRPKGA